MLTRLVVVRGLLRLFFFDDMFEPKTKKRELTLRVLKHVANSKKKNTSLSTSLALSLDSVSVNLHKEDTKKLRKRHANRQRSSSSSSSLRQSPSKRAFDPRRVRHKKCAVFVTRGQRVRRRRRRRKKAQKPLLDGTPKKLKI